MSLETKIIALAQSIGADIKGVRAGQGDLTALSTTAKESLVLAINELHQALNLYTQIDDMAGDGNTSATWSADKIYDMLALKAALSSPAFVGTPTAPTAAMGVNTTQVATTAFVQSAVGGYIAKAVTGGTVTLTAAEASNVALKLSGTLTSNLLVVVPTTVPRAWIISNETTGAFTVTVKTAAGTGVLVSQGKRNFVYTDGVNVYNGVNDIDFTSVALTGSPTAPTPAAGDNDTSVATTAFVNTAVTGSLATAAPLVAGTAAVGTSTKFAREDHRHPTDTTRAALNSPTFTGTPLSTTAIAGTNTAQIATTAFVQSAISALVNGAGGALDTLAELATALGNDPNFATTIATGLSYRLRFDAAQSLSTAQQLQACINIGVGNPEYNFVTDYNTAKV